MIYIWGTILIFMAIVWIAYKPKTIKAKAIIIIVAITLELLITLLLVGAGDKPLPGAITIDPKEVYK